jgi:hypothetical protein
MKPVVRARCGYCGRYPTVIRPEGPGGRLRAHTPAESSTPCQGSGLELGAGELLYLGDRYGRNIQGRYCYPLRYP